MPKERSRTSPGPGRTLFSQIALRLGMFALIFVALDIGIVLVTYSREPEALAQQLLTLEANRVVQSPGVALSELSGPPGTTRWSVRYVSPQQVHPNSVPTDPGSNGAVLMDWTQRERVDGGYRISGVRSVNVAGQPRWLLMELEGAGLQPFWPVISNELLEHVLLPLIPLSLLMLVFNIVSVRRVLDPLRRAEEEANQLDPDNSAARLTEPTSPREVSTLVRAFNGALSRLDASVATLREFTENAAHELRTPLSIMQLSLDRLPPGKVRAELAKDTSYMTRLVGQMLDLAQADALAIDNELLVNIGAVGRDAVAALAPMALEQGMELVFEDRGDALVPGHAEAIFRMFRNLIDNALSHAPGSGQVEIVAGPGPQLSVRDHGPGIPEADRSKIFERFWRKDRRASNGAGLGLGIVMRLVQAHDASLSVEDAPGGGALFRVRFRSRLA